MSTPLLAPASDVPPAGRPSRRSLLRAVAGVGTAAGVGVATPAVLGLVADPAAAGTTTGARRAPTCTKKQVKVKGRCKPRKKKPKGEAKPTLGATSKPGSPVTLSPGGGGQPTVPTPPVLAAPPIIPGTLLGAADRHLVTRFSYGVDRALADQVAAAGGGPAWFEAQLATPGTADPATDGLRAWWPSLSRTTTDLWQRQQAGSEGGWEVMFDYQRHLLIRRLRSTRPVLDVMTEFWENHLNVPVNGDAAFLFRVSYGDTIRAHALGRFADLLTAAITHPAMLVYLSAAVSTAKAPNENLGRELLELHTVGRGQYGEADVKASARILTGYHVDMWRTWAVSYRTADHFVGPVAVMGFTDANAAADGRATAAAYLSYLAHHPATARRLARKLAVKFVSDTPSDALVERLAQVYLANDTAIAPVLRALVAAPEFAAAQLAKVRDPGEDVVATYRALGVGITGPGNDGDGSAERAILWQTQQLGDLPHVWPRPDGAPADNASWSSPSRLLASLDLHYTMSGGFWPNAGLSRRTPAQWLPAPSVRFDDLVDHLCGVVLHLPTPPRMLQACCQSVDVAADEVITAEHPLVRWYFPRLLTTVLDSPHFLKR